MLAMIAIAALLAASEPAQEDLEGNLQEEIVFFEDESEETALNEDSEYQDPIFFEDESEEIALNEDSEYQDLIFFEDESEPSEDVLVEDDK